MKIRLALVPALVLALFTAACVEQPVDAPEPAPLSDDLDLEERAAYTRHQSYLVEADTLTEDVEDGAYAEKAIECRDNWCCTVDRSLCCYFYEGAGALCL